MTWPLPHIHVLRGTWTPVQWAQRLKRVFSIDIETCPECGGKLRIIACIENPQLIRQILSHVRQRDGLSDFDARSAKDKETARYFNSLDVKGQEKLRYLVLLGGWIAAIIYPNFNIKNVAQDPESGIPALI